MNHHSFQDKDKDKDMEVMGGVWWLSARINYHSVPTLHASSLVAIMLLVMMMIMVIRMIVMIMMIIMITIMTITAHCFAGASAKCIVFSFLDIKSDSQVKVA